MIPKAPEKLETVDRILVMLECFTDEKPEWGVTELGEQLGLYKSVVHRMLSTLERRGYVVKNPHTKKYALGLKLFELGMLVGRQMNLRAIARPVMEELGVKTNETVLLSIADSLSGVCIEKIESNQSIKSTSQLGKRVPLYAGAPTKLLLAYLPPESIDAVIANSLVAYTEQTTVEPDRLSRDLEEIRRQGYCITYGELDIGSAGVAFPICNHEGKTIASLSVVGPEFRMKDAMRTYWEHCREAAHAISRQLGCEIRMIETWNSGAGYPLR
ncbi:IclR family transcriptional regulator [Paenibacillus hamazuiensis]|uniref:IclR family transcriptional regulator n=1 Tax=Paenibacillus hamazuiensis TaxID=2936508 RepID=UPI002010BFE0|nr:IclR family transcriptional regulator [Paenibacillus hamazuiensis]